MSIEVRAMRVGAETEVTAPHPNEPSFLNVGTRAPALLQAPAFDGRIPTQLGFTFAESES